jgi:hypothetical protein
MGSISLGFFLGFFLCLLFFFFSASLCYGVAWMTGLVICNDVDFGCYADWDFCKVGVSWGIGNLFSWFDYLVPVVLREGLIEPAEGADYGVCIASCKRLDFYCINTSAYSFIILYACAKRLFLLKSIGPTLLLVSILW